MTFHRHMHFRASILLPKFLGILVFDQANEGALEAAEELGTASGLQFTGPTPENSVQGQIEIVTNAVTQGAEAIMLSNNAGDQIAQRLTSDQTVYAKELQPPHAVGVPSMRRGSQWEKFKREPPPPPAEPEPAPPSGSASADFACIDGDATAGATHYAMLCASCHGGGRLGLSGPALLPQNLSRLKKSKAAAVIEQGRPATQMPGFGGQITDDQLQFPPPEVDRFTEHFWGLIQFWRKTEADRLGLEGPEGEAT